MLCVAPLVYAQDAARPKTKVWVSHSGSDNIGRELAYEVREHIRRSAAYELGTDAEHFFAIRLVTLDPDINNASRGAATVAAVTITVINLLPYRAGNPQTWLPIYLTSTIVLSGRSRTSEMAKGIVADLDREAEDYRAALLRVSP